MAVVKDIIRLMDGLAPKELAQDWDNSGLQIGSPEFLVKRVLVALDPSLPVVQAACEKKIDLLITHHPLIFRPVKSLNFNTPLGKIIEMAAFNKLSIFSAHTNLDMAPAGLNDIFSKKIGLTDLSILCPDAPEEKYKLSVFVPIDHFQKVLDALFELGVCNIDDYSCCTFYHQGKGTFKPGAFSKPYIGETGEITHADEIRIEATIRKIDLKKTIEHIRLFHPYETMAYDVYPLFSDDIENGFGRIGSLPESVSLASFAKDLKSRFGLEYIKVSGQPDMPVQKIAVCTGSGSSMMKYFLRSDAQVLVTGDLKYHDARDAEVTGRALVDIGHFASEKIMIEFIQQYLKNRIEEKKYDISVDAWTQETDPFSYI